MFEKGLVDSRGTNAVRITPLRPALRSDGLISSGEATDSFDAMQGGWVPATAFDDLLQDAVSVGLRRWVPDDAPVYHRILSDARLWRYLPENRPADFDRAASDALLQIAMDDTLNTVRAITWLGQAVGQVRLTPIRNGEAEVSYWIAGPFQGNGLATTALRAFIKQCFADESKLHLVVANVHPDNAASIQVMAQAGFSSDCHGPSEGSILRFVLHRAV